MLPNFTTIPLVPSKAHEQKILGDKPTSPRSFRTIQPTQAKPQHQCYLHDLRKDTPEKRARQRPQRKSKRLRQESHNSVNHAGIGCGNHTMVRAIGPSSLAPTFLVLPFHAMSDSPSVNNQVKIMDPAGTLPSPSLPVLWEFTRTLTSPVLPSWSVLFQTNLLDASRIQDGST